MDVKTPYLGVVRSAPRDPEGLCDAMPPAHVFEPPLPADHSGRLGDPGLPAVRARRLFFKKLRQCIFVPLLVGPPPQLRRRLHHVRNHVWLDVLAPAVTIGPEHGQEGQPELGEHGFHVPPTPFRQRP